MSRTVDERVVEMRFDNKNFESNVATSMSTLDKLKQKLNLSGASKGLEDIDAASKKVNMTGLGGAVDTVKAKFSALDVVAVTALANITNQAVNAGKRMVSALTIDPIMSGFKEYETQINSVQTILANTSSKGTTIDDVTANSKIDLQPSVDQLVQLHSNETSLIVANDNKVITVYAIGTKPTTDYVIQATLSETTDN